MEIKSNGIANPVADRVELAPGAKIYKASSDNSPWDYFIREKKVGEGTYAVVYIGWAIPKPLEDDQKEIQEVKEEPETKKKEDEETEENLKEHSLKRKREFLDSSNVENNKDDIPKQKIRVAIKKIRAGHFKDGLDRSAIREVKFLQETNHNNIISLLDVFAHKSNLNLVLEFLHGDLEQIIKNKKVVFSAGDIKSWMLMTLRGLHHCHVNFILHRDIKPNNLLLSDKGILKLADFGMAREFGDPSRNMSPVVVTRWYRAPELLLGSNKYGYAVDMWAVGCVFAELMLRVPFLAAHSDIQQLETIFKALGTPSQNEWPGLSKLPGYHNFKHYPRTPIRTIFTAATPDSLDLLERFLSFDPLKRPTSSAALHHPYFYNNPRPTLPHKLPKP